MNYECTFVRLDRQCLCGRVKCMSHLKLFAHIHCSQFTSYAFMNRLTSSACYAGSSRQCHSCAVAACALMWVTVSTQVASGLHGRVLMKVVRWRPSCQTQKQFRGYICHGCVRALNAQQARGK